MWKISYWVLPIISGFCWASTLLTLFIYWVCRGRPRYESMDPTQSIAFISDVGATSMKPLFVTGCCLTTIFLDLSLLSERWLRHTGRLAKNTSIGQKLLVWLSITFAAFGTSGLILLGIFDTLRYPRLHDIFLVIFISGYLLSAIFICSEYHRLGNYHRQQPILRNSFWMKLVFIVIELITVAIFAIAGLTGHANTAAILEWVIAFIFTLYVFSFFIDLIPALDIRERKESMSSEHFETELQQEISDDLGNHGIRVTPKFLGG